MKSKWAITTLGLIFVAIIVTSATKHLFENETKLKTIPLASIPGISAKVLASQNYSLHIEDPVTCLEESNTYLFSATILTTQHFGKDLDYRFAGDAKRIDHFVREIDFVNKGYDGPVGVTRQVLEGAADDVFNLVKSLLSLVENVIFSPKETAKTFGCTIGAITDYSNECIHRRANPVTDITAFANAYVENVRMQTAAEYGLNYEELITPDAKASTIRLGRAEIAGTGISEIAQLFFVWTKIGKIIAPAKTVEAVTEAMKVYERLDDAKAASTATKWDNFFADGLKAGEGIARTTEFDAAVEKMSNLEEMADILCPTRITGLNSERALNPHLHRLLYWLNQEEKSGKNVSEALTRAMKMAGADKRMPDLFLDPKIDHTQILKNYNLAKDLKVFDDKSNLDLMKNGKAPWINTPWGFEQIQVDHEIALNWAPELDKSWGNLSYQTRKANLMRQDKPTSSSIKKLMEYKEAGMLSQNRVDEIIRKAAKVPAQTI